MTLVASETRRPGEPLVAGSRPIRSVPARSSGAKSEEGRTCGRWLLGSALYSLTLGYGTPRSFFAVAADNWPGDSALGQRLLLAGEFAACGSVGTVLPDSDDPPWQRATAQPLWLDALNGFAWLRDLRDNGDPRGALLAARLVDDWTNREWRWSPVTWKRHVLAARIVAWYLAHGLRNVVYALAPERIVLGGRAGVVGALLLAYFSAYPSYPAAATSSHFSR